jgi:hypothetical protein
MVHEFGGKADVEFDDGEVVPMVEVCSHFLSGEAHTNPKAIQDDLERRRRAALEAEGKLVDRGVRDPMAEGGLMVEVVMGLDNDKYVVFKKQEFDAWWGETREDMNQRLGHFALEDAVVIRLQDVFAGPGLYAYANAIQTAIDLQDMEGCGDLGPERTEQLLQLRDFFAAMAQLAVDRSDKKIPD